PEAFFKDILHFSGKKRGSLPSTDASFQSPQVFTYLPYSQKAEDIGFSQKWIGRQRESKLINVSVQAERYIVVFHFSLGHNGKIRHYFIRVRKVHRGLQEFKPLISKKYPAVSCFQRSQNSRLTDSAS